MSKFKHLVAAAALAIAGSANATPVLPGNETSLQTIIDGLYTAAGTSTALAPNVNANQLPSDELWSIQASGGSISTFIVEFAGLGPTNSFGIFDATDSSKTVQLFGPGDPQNGGERQLVGITADGSVILGLGTDTGVDFAGNAFGYYLTAGGNTWLSTDKDQMVAFQGDGDLIKLPIWGAGIWGSSSYILAWEDVLYADSDKDFNDFVVYVESVSPVPAPASAALLGLGLLGMGLARRRRSA